MIKYADIAIVSIVMLFAVTLILAGVPLHADFIHSSPIAILGASVLVFTNHTGDKKRFFLFIALCLVLACIVEWVNDQTNGALFGHLSFDYHWPLRVAGVPLIVCAMWLFASYVSGAALHIIPASVSRIATVVAHAFLTALLLTFIDYGTSLWEPESPSWLHPFLGRWAAAIPLSVIFAWQVGQLENSVARRAWGITALFLLALGYVMG